MICLPIVRWGRGTSEAGGGVPFPGARGSRVKLMSPSYYPSTTLRVVPFPPCFARGEGL